MCIVRNHQCICFMNKIEKTDIGKARVAKTVKKSAYVIIGGEGNVSKWTFSNP